MIKPEDILEQWYPTEFSDEHGSLYSRDKVILMLRDFESQLSLHTGERKSQMSIELNAAEYVRNQSIDYGDLNEKAESQIKDAYIAGQIAKV